MGWVLNLCNARRKMTDTRNSGCTVMLHSFTFISSRLSTCLFVQKLLSGIPATISNLLSSSVSSRSFKEISFLQSPDKPSFKCCGRQVQQGSARLSHLAESVSFIAPNKHLKPWRIVEIPEGDAVPVSYWGRFGSTSPRNECPGLCLRNSSGNTICIYEF